MAGLSHHVATAERWKIGTCTHIQTNLKRKDALCFFLKSTLLSSVQETESLEILFRPVFACTSHLGCEEGLPKHPYLSSWPGKDDNQEWPTSVFLGNACLLSLLRARNSFSCPSRSLSMGKEKQFHGINQILPKHLGCQIRYIPRPEIFWDGI